MGAAASTIVKTTYTSHQILYTQIIKKFDLNIIALRKTTRFYICFVHLRLIGMSFRLLVSNILRLKPRSQQTTSAVSFIDSANLLYTYNSSDNFCSVFSYLAMCQTTEISHSVIRAISNELRRCIIFTYLTQTASIFTCAITTDIETIHWASHISERDTRNRKHVVSMLLFAMFL